MRSEVARSGSDPTNLMSINTSAQPTIRSFRQRLLRPLALGDVATDTLKATDD